MPSTSILFGVLLIIVGIIGYGYAVSSGNASVTALIPAFFGILLVIFGFVGRSNENLRKHMMHAAAAVALLGFLATAWRLVPNLGNLAFSAAVMAQVAMCVLCLLFVILAVRSFIQARVLRSGE
ncbi:MAG: hypothetical protein KF855_08185 [Acidobacteria bacterium]|nr:hypothetical protein [Acidobacteriota bacterium]